MRHEVVVEPALAASMDAEEGMREEVSTAAKTVVVVTAAQRGGSLWVVSGAWAGILGGPRSTIGKVVGAEELVAMAAWVGAVVIRKPAD